MDLATGWITFDAPAGETAAYIARPQAAAAPLPGIVVLQEIWGVDAHIADLVERFATAGYFALAPDLYSVGGGRPAALTAERVTAAQAFLNSVPQSEWMAVVRDEERRQEALLQLPGDEPQNVGETLGELFGGARDPERSLAIARPAADFLRSHPACSGRRIGSVGYCMGGGLSAQLACTDPELSAAVIYYGASPRAEQVASIRCPVRGFYGENDPHIVAGLPDFEAALAAAGADHELRTYPNTGHAFFNDRRPSYQPESARDAWGRTLAFLAETLSPLTA
ncbi:MAG TPA: dienelactone hydrolase family protein [Solirubrobacteraceae bacterium]|jgi:carboxymethylenebutenolidase|nr:dienelactone hydrolase family protein [Solirubrobacteraceae bacterium]